MENTSWILGIVSFTLIGIIGIMAKLFWSGFQATLIQSILDSSLNKLLGNFNETITGLRDDISFVRTSQDHIRQFQNQSVAEHTYLRNELANLQGRLSDHLTEAAGQSNDYYNFKREVQDFMRRVIAFMQNHEHVGARTAAPGISGPVTEELK